MHRAEGAGTRVRVLLLCDNQCLRAVRVDYGTRHVPIV